MQTIFSTDEVQSKDRFRKWREICEDRLVPMAQNCLSDEPFDATIEGASVGNLAFTKFALRNLKAATTPQTLRHENNKTDYLFMSIVLRGTVRANQYDHSTTDSAGDFSVRDTNTPWTIEHNGYSEVLAIQIPRERLEGMLGSTRRFAGLTVGGSLPTTTLTRSFLRNLLSVGDRLVPEAAERMASTGIDLVVASLAERMAMEPPKALHGTLIVQRARAYVAAHFGDPALGPAEVAAAVGVSLRHLQTLFREDGHNIAAWIWQLRLEKAAQRLSDPACLHLQLGEVAYRCGFADQAHFSRRFRDRYAMSPRAYRHTAALSRAAGLQP
ncbi:MAG: helix-turn-helix domain-containing protein [Parafilimonas terrae]|jgi:AraC family transcriptional regulator, positive regulator of tynA and feaB|nr:helix-turn-helix domain-containing protein [Parafilimonas terrae]